MWEDELVEVAVDASQRAVVVVDPISTGANLAQALYASGI
jgi:hypothetical protein